MQMGVHEPSMPQRSPPGLPVGAGG
jgi:hypothetical protein